MMMMMGRNLKHTMMAVTTQCPHYNTGYCKFNDQCRYPHYYTICEKSICKDIECKKRHPKTCRNGENCKFNKQNACAYKHDAHNQSQIKDTKNLTDKTESIEKEVKILKAEISHFKGVVRIKEKMLKENSIGISEMKEKIKLLECKNETLKTQIEEEKTKNSKLKTLIIAKDERINILDKKMSVIEKNENFKEVKQNGDIEIQNSSQFNSCPYCGKTFKSKLILNEHIINHSGQNVLSFKCLDSGDSDWETDDE